MYVCALKVARKGETADIWAQGRESVQNSLKGRVTSVHVNFASAFCKPYKVPSNSPKLQRSDKCSVCGWEKFSLCLGPALQGLLTLFTPCHPTLQYAGWGNQSHSAAKLLTVTFFLLPPSFVAHKYGDSADGTDATRGTGRELWFVWIFCMQNTTTTRDGSGYPLPYSALL